MSSGDTATRDPDEKRKNTEGGAERSLDDSEELFINFKKGGKFVDQNHLRGQAKNVPNKTSIHVASQNHHKHYNSYLNDQEV